MARTLTAFTCTACGFESPRWLGRCTGCGEWNTLVEEVRERAAANGAKRPARREPRPLAEVEPDGARRISTGSAEFDRVLGGGLVSGSLVLVGGEPGVGKSSLLLQALGAIGQAGRSTLLVSGEESPAQVRMRAERIGAVDHIAILAETELETVCETILGPDYQIVELGFDIPFAGAKHQPWHRDFRSAPEVYRDRRLTSLAFNLTAVDTIEEMGPFEVAPGTQ